MKLSKILSMPVPEIKLSFHPEVPFAQRVQLKRPSEAAALLRKYWNDDFMELKEEVKIILMSCNSRVLGIADISSGGVDNCNVDLKMLFAIAITGRGNAMILAHNHPSGTLEASEADLTLTKVITGIAKLLEIHLIDHIILTRDGYYSLVENNLMPTLPIKKSKRTKDCN